MNEQYVPIIKFTDQSNSFACGVEAGMLYSRFKNETEMFEATSHVENREVLTSMAEYYDWDITIIESEVEGWDYLTATKKQKSKPKFTLIKND
jgi:hypothetical protein